MNKLYLIDIKMNKISTFEKNMCKTYNTRSGIF